MLPSVKLVKLDIYLEKTWNVKVFILIYLEICGDGLNLGHHECDDGNTFDGDGCSSQCKVESGYKCYAQNKGPDICKDITPLTATIKVIQGNAIAINFNKRIELNIKSNLYINFRQYTKAIHCY